MKIFQLLSFLMVTAGVSVAAPATKESVERLMILTNVKGMVGNMHKELSGVATGLLNAAVKKTPLTAEDQATMAAAQAAIVAQAKNEVSWEKMRDAMVPLYQETFSQAEIDGMI